jgi:hypothetical protein
MRDSPILFLRLGFSNQNADAIGMVDGCARIVGLHGRGFIDVNAGSVAKPR